MKDDIEIINIEKPSILREKVNASLRNWLNLFPKNTSALILLKPNFNSNFNALTGNTTDMRLLSAVIEFLQENNYLNVVITEGTSSGFFREEISVIQRLGADKLAAHYGVEIVDLNVWPQGINVTLENGDIVQVADLMKKADFIINMPKLKTHFEVGMSVCLKNLIGACIGRENKKKIHGSLAKNIVHLNETIKPDLHIVDGLIAMEGNGPSRGMPVNFGKVIIGTNPYKLDFISARLIGFPRDEVKTLVQARRMGCISDTEYSEWEDIAIDEYIQEFKRPKLTPIVAFVIHPHFQKHLIRIRYAPIINSICSIQIVKNLFYKLGISHEHIRKENSNLSINLDSEKCNSCGKCQDYCPIMVGLKEIGHGRGEKCIGCLYCYSVCPNKAIRLKGYLGYYADQIDTYGDIIRDIT